MGVSRPVRCPSAARPTFWPRIPERGGLGHELREGRALFDPPEEFRPERWAGAGREFHRLAYFPFGVGGIRPDPEIMKKYRFGQ